VHRPRVRGLRRRPGRQRRPTTGLAAGP
jgi:hypothetical protein